MKPERQRLIEDVLGAENRRESTLLAGAGILRRRRRWRRARQGFAATAIAMAVAVWLTHPGRNLAPKQVVAPRPAQATDYGHRLTDDELLGLFPDTPVGLVTLADGRKQLIFPRPGDEQRYLKQL